MSEQKEYNYLTFSQSVAKLERELHENYLGGFYQWADETHSNAWTEAANRLERGLKLVIDGVMSRSDFQIEQALYFERCSELIALYRKHKGLDESEQFITSLKQGEDNGRKQETLAVEDDSRELCSSCGSPVLSACC